MLEAEGYALSAGQLSRIERGDQAYTQDLLEPLARVLDCSPDELISRDPSAPLDIMDIYHSLLPAQQTQLVEIAKTIKRTAG
jgi:transcriptional regulator with XRE-family HTH domain